MPYTATLDTNGTEDEFTIRAPDGRPMTTIQFWDTDEAGSQRAHADAKFILDALNAYRGRGMTALYETPAMKLGNHEWRVIVRPSDYHGNVIEYQFRRGNGEPWSRETLWPSWNGNDTYCGLPRSLSRLYRKHYAEIQAALAGEPSPQTILL